MAMTKIWITSTRGNGFKWVQLVGWSGRDGRKLSRWRGEREIERVKQLYILTFKTHHTAAILLKFSVQHVDGSVIRRIVVARIVDHHIVAIVVQHEGALLVAGEDSFLQVAALDSRGDVDLASGESAQHYAGNAEVNRRPDMTLGELIRAATVEDDKILVRLSQLPVQLLTRNDLYIVVRHLAEPLKLATPTTMHPKSRPTFLPHNFSRHTTENTLATTWIVATAASSRPTSTNKRGYCFSLHNKTIFLFFYLHSCNTQHKPTSIISPFKNIHSANLGPNASALHSGVQRNSTTTKTTTRREQHTTAPFEATRASVRRAAAENPILNETRMK